MKNLIAVSVLIFAFTICRAQSEQKLNLGFEKQSNIKELSDGWFKWGDYTLSIDTLCKTGKKSGKITSVSNGQFGCIAYKIPANYSGKRIVLEGYMKIKNVENGFAGLLLRIDGNNKSLAFDNMQQQNISGTKDWQRYRVELDYPQKAETIFIAGILTGKGEAWYDDFELTIDGESIHLLKEIEKNTTFKASADTEFDKGSGILTIPTNKAVIENLKTVGLIWGFLKYHHPNIAKGEYNWDYELFRIIPKVLNQKSKGMRDEIMVKWIDSLGPFLHGDESLIEETKIKLRPDVDWIENSGFSDELTSLLLKVKYAKRSNEHYYIGLHPNVANPDFKRENSYSWMRYPDTGFRLLSLFRYWNIIQYYFPYKNLIEEDWKDVLTEFIPRFIDAKDETEYTLTTLELIGRIHDTHANIYGGNLVLNNYFGQCYAAPIVKFVENKPVITGFYNEKFGEETGLKSGDVICSINNKPVDEIISERLKYFPASNYPVKLRNIAFSLLRTNDSLINIEIIRENKKESKILKAYTSNQINRNMNFQSADTCFKMINKDIAYINNGTLKRAYLPAIWKEVENTKGLIIDIRNYPSDFPIYELCNYLMPESTPFVKFSNGSIESPGLFTFTEPYNAGKKNENYYKGKVVILVNEVSQSSAEYHSMAYRVNPNSIIIGSTTAGADGNVLQIYLPGGISTMISGIGVYYPDGRETQRVGIVPDIVVMPTIQGVKEGRDEVLEKAIEVINKK